MLNIDIGATYIAKIGNGKYLVKIIKEVKASQGTHKRCFTSQVIIKPKIDKVISSTGINLIVWENELSEISEDDIDMIKVM